MPFASEAYHGSLNWACSSCRIFSARRTFFRWAFIRSLRSSGRPCLAGLEESTVVSYHCHPRFPQYSDLCFRPEHRRISTMTSIGPQSIYLGLQSRQVGHDVSLRLLRWRWRTFMRRRFVDLTKTGCIRSQTVFARSPGFGPTNAAPGRRATTSRRRSRWCGTAAFVSLDTVVGGVGGGADVRGAALGEVATRWRWHWLVF
jgi:hypothetical protein